MRYKGKLMKLLYFVTTSGRDKRKTTNTEASGDNTLQGAVEQSAHRGGWKPGHRRDPVLPTRVEQASFQNQMF